MRQIVILLCCFSSNSTYSNSNTSLYHCYPRGNIDTDDTSDEFGHLTGDVNLFTDTDGFVPTKVNRIKSLAESMASTDDYSRCEELLEEFHTVCDPQANSCPANNTQSFQLSLAEVRASVNAAEKMIFSNITLFDGLETLNPFEQPGFNEEIIAWYENQSHGLNINSGIGSILDGNLRIGRYCQSQWLVEDAFVLYGISYWNIGNGGMAAAQSLVENCRNIMIAELNRIEAEWNGNVEDGVICQSVSYAAVNELGYEFSRLYEGRNKTMHPDRNPMELNPNEPVHDVDPKTFDALSRMRFPKAYIFEQTDHGVMHLRDELERYEFVSNLEGFPGTSTPTIGTWQIEIQTWQVISHMYSYQYSLEGCLSSQRDTELVSSAMKAADESLALLAGNQVSVGTIRRHAALVNDKSIPNASELLPGKCCLDDPLDSDFLGYNVSKNLLVVAVSLKSSPHLFLFSHIHNSMTLIMKTWNVSIPDHIISE